METIYTYQDNYKLLNVITDILDNNIKKKRPFKHYMVRVMSSDKRVFYLRIPGMTVGCVEANTDMIIENIIINKTDNIYTSDTEDKLKKFIGYKLHIVEN